MPEARSDAYGRRAESMPHLPACIVAFQEGAREIVQPVALALLYFEESLMVQSTFCRLLLLCPLSIDKLAGPIV
jgi:hypothetical protein